MVKAVMRIGVLALQGDFAKHVERIRALGEEAKEVRKPEDLLDCDGLILPGGESTVMMRQMDFIRLREPLLAFARQKPVFGTCAGVILMSKSIRQAPFSPLELLDITVERNAFGRQIESFRTFLTIERSPEHTQVIPAFFIRAPRIRQCEEGVQVLATFEGEPVLVQQGHHLGATFHPELTDSPFIHRYFIEMIKISTTEK